MLNMEKAPDTPHETAAEAYRSIHVALSYAVETHLENCDYDAAMAAAAKMAEIEKQPCMARTVIAGPPFMGGHVVSIPMHDDSAERKRMMEVLRAGIGRNTGVGQCRKG